MKSENKYNNKSKSKTLSLDFQSLRSMNDTNMSSIDKKIKNKYSSALEYLNSFSHKQSTIQNNSTINSEKFQKLRNEMLTSIYDNIHYSNYKTTNLENSYLKQNHTRNNSLTSEKVKEHFKTKINYLSPQKKIDNKTNNSTILSLYNSPSFNEKTKEKIKQIFNIFNPNYIQNDKNNKNNKNKNKKKKRALHYQILDETSAAYKLRELREKKKYQTQSIENYKNGEKVIIPLTSRYVSKINPHVDLYDKVNGLNTQKSASCQRLIHMTKVIQADLIGKNPSNNLDLKIHLNNNLKRDLFAITHEGKIRNKIVDFHHFSIFPDIHRRNKKDELLNAYAENNLKIISDIKGDLAKKKQPEENANNTNTNYIQTTLKVPEKKEEPKIDVKEDIDIDDLLD